MGVTTGSEAWPDTAKNIEENLNEWLEGAFDSILDDNPNKNHIAAIKNIITKNLPEYITHMDDILTKARDKLTLEVREKEEYEKYSESDLLIAATQIAGSKSVFIKIANEVENLNNRETAWKLVADLFKQIRMDGLADYFGRLHEKRQNFLQAAEMFKASKENDGLQRVLKNNNQTNASVVTTAKKERGYQRIE